MSRSSDIFISWSGKESGPVAAALAKMIRRVFANQVNVFTSFQSIELGEEWLKHVKEGMSCEIVLFLLNPLNLNAPWINIEAGMAIKAADDSGKPRLVPMLMGLTEKKLPALFSQYQSANCDYHGIRQLMHNINQLRSPLIMPNEDVDASFDAHWQSWGQDVETAVAEIGSKTPKPDSLTNIDDSPTDLWKAHFDWCPSARWRHCCLVLSNPREAGRPGNGPDPDLYELICRHLTDGTRVTHMHHDRSLIVGFESTLKNDELVPDHVKRQLFDLLAQVVIPASDFRQVADCVLFDIEYTSESRGYHLVKSEGGANIVWERLEDNELQRRAEILKPYLRDLDELRRGFRAAHIQSSATGVSSRPAVFLSVPFTAMINAKTGLVEGDHRSHVTRLLSLIRQLDYECFCALEREQWGANLDTPASAFVDDRDRIISCDGVVALLGNPLSPGVLMELAIAAEHNIPMVIYQLHGGPVPYLLPGLSQRSNASIHMVDSIESILDRLTRDIETMWNFTAG